MLLIVSTAVLIVLAGWCRAQDNFYFSRNPANTDVVAGSGVTLQCEVSNATGIAYYWQLNGQSIGNTTRRYQRGSNLHITRADRVRDGGQFTCIAMNVSTGFSITSMAASLNILWLGEPVLVQLQTPDSPHKIEPGNNVTLRCSVDGSGEIHIDWYRNADLLSKSETVSFSKKRLHLKNVSSKDNGVYRCSARNEAGSRNSADNFSLTVADNGSALIKVIPRNQLVKKGDSAKFDCVYQNASITEWYVKEKTEPIKNNNRITVFGNGSLLIQNVKASDEGFYSCVGIPVDSNQVPQTYTAELNIAYLDDMTSNSFEPPLPASRTRIVPEKAEFELTCIPVAGNPPVRVWWLDPRGHTISDTGVVRVDETRLIIEAARAVDDTGNYTCVAENMAGTKMASFNLVVSTPPNIVMDPLSMTVEEGDRASLACQFHAMAHPVTTVVWKKNGKLLADDGARIKMNKRNGTLVISEVMLEDQGNYSCLVNTTGFKPVHSKPALVLVKEKLKFSPRPVNKKLELGSSARVYCKAQGARPPVIKWFKEGQQGEQMFEISENVKDINGTLHFSNVSAEDKGRYICVATNSQGIINATIDIDVIVTPKFRVFPQNPTEAYEGYPVMIHCIAEGDPKPTIKWDRNSNFSAFDRNRFHVFENGTLLVQEVHMADSGKYGCTAGNSGGFKREEVTLIVRSPEGYHPNDDQDADGSMMTKTFTITLSIAGSYMMLVVGLMIWCRHRRRRRKQAYLNANGAEVTKAENGEAVGEHTELKETAVGQQLRDAAGDGADTAQSHSSSQSRRSNKSSSFDRLAFPRQDLNNMVLLGRGEFGEVFLARAKGLHDGDDKEKETVVMVKSLQNTKEESALQEFKREMDMFHKLQHPHVVKLLGLCRETDPNYMILEYSDWGDLKQFLLATRGGGAKDGSSSKNAAGANSKSPRPPQLSVTQIIQLASQVVQGMEHLSNQRFVHRDLAARNCLIASNLTVKVSLSALTKDTYNKEYCKHRNEVIPLRWMPYEAVFEDDYSTKSDVYSFACLVWEMFYQGELPFSKMSDDTVLAALKKHELQWKPHKAAPQSLQSLLVSCWSDSPRDRPTFSQLTVTIGEISIDSAI
ncbi:inactive tyrosine-protein kinase 7 isoform X2 [Periplaneta americana]|uniref:inactive tyrosine-protein kinase 7 isoform X2 n=1 Tax=Periplaneta americana TaxID=6978 RepID=UPI0037E77CE4